MAKILVIEDDFELTRLITKAMQAERHQLESTGDGSEGLRLSQGGSFDLLIIDLELPRLDGLEICRQYREANGPAAILILTGKAQIADKEAGFFAGADDYLTKPFSLRELSLRVNALLRRPPAPAHQFTIALGPLSLDMKTHKIFKDGMPLHLTPQDFSLLEFFLRHPNQVFSAEELLAKVWPTDDCSSVQALRSSIKRIRLQIDDGEKSGSMIESFRKIGYMLVV
jgi:DNA-binding response OmpR family regulator